MCDGPGTRYRLFSVTCSFLAQGKLPFCGPYFWCVLRDEHQSISVDLSVHFLASTAAAGFDCYNAAILLSAASQPNVYWSEEVVGPVAQRGCEWATASRTFSAITDLISVVQHEVDMLFVFIS